MMAGSQQRRRWSVFIFLLFMCTDISASTLKPDSECLPGDYKNINGICCNKCSPGFRLEAECQNEGHRSKCTPCPDRQFSDQINYSRTCRRCRTCKESRNEYEKKSCTKEQDTICVCKYGYYKRYIDSETYECLRCSTCKEDEKIKQTCTQERNTVCECKENFHRVNGKCQRCRNCTMECSHHCVSVESTKQDSPSMNSMITNVLAGSGVVVFILLAAGIFITFMATKRFTQKKMLSQSSQPSDVSMESGKLLIEVKAPSENSGLMAVVPTPVAEQESSNLPDCVPLEIRIPDLIYTVLDLVPVLQVKQLVRCLGVKDTEIEQAEMDHRSCREAHYQMLRVWAERGSWALGGGRSEMLHRRLLEELLDQLRQMHLGRAAEELETKYPIQ